MAGLHAAKATLVVPPRPESWCEHKIAAPCAHAGFNNYFINAYLAGGT
jgi:hypothetical protein